MDISSKKHNSSLTKNVSTSSEYIQKNDSTTD
ncbi:hypothetical protein BCD96_005706 [Clostridium beijerinckii]|nr:hypothetical protein [Clostridium beijerinckii]NRU41642.1 hypothetical protein [Clostridium beijerinckii]NSB00814.1 hypothetical protein [Clostridium beijerinckii]